MNITYAKIQPKMGQTYSRMISTPVGILAVLGLDGVQDNNNIVSCILLFKSNIPTWLWMVWMQLLYFNWIFKLL